MERIQNKDQTASEKGPEKISNDSTCKCFNKRWFKTVSNLKSQLKFEKENPGKIPKNP
jgi:hypothetical protein